MNTTALAAGSAPAQGFSAEDLGRRHVERRAVEAVIWGMAAVNADLMLQEMLTKTAGKMNQLIYWGRPLDWHNQTLTPNPDAIYFMAFFNTKDVGPIVLDIPPGDANASLNGNIVTVWQTALEDVGLLGLDKGAGGKFVILPPGYKEEVPAGRSACRRPWWRSTSVQDRNTCSRRATRTMPSSKAGRVTSCTCRPTSPPRTSGRSWPMTPTAARFCAMGNLSPRSAHTPARKRTPTTRSTSTSVRKSPLERQRTGFRPPGKGWFVLFRFYGPLEPFFDKTWKPGDIEEVR